MSVLEFGALARRLSLAVATLGLRSPGFRSPAQLPDRTRTVRRFPGGGAMVSITTRGRTPAAILDDMIEGVLVVNGLHDGKAQATKRTLLRLLDTPTGSRAA